ncbi:MAG: hypothetical protein M1837_001782 [Sclerophora amabilis]|nr:MAG: hypothetical protein M1837_001782 [Sclerophora amabilis]
MDQSDALPKTSRLPRLSKLPVPQLGPSSIPQLQTTKGTSVFKSGSTKPAESGASRLRGSYGSNPRTVRVRNGDTSTGRVASRRPLAQTDHVDGAQQARDSSDDAVFKRPARMSLSHQARGAEVPNHLERHPALEEIPDHNEELQREAGLPSKSNGTEGHLTSRPRKARPSLSERTMETLSQIPPSPSPRRRRSSIYGVGSPVRPASAMSNRSRPGSSLECYTQSPTSSFKPKFSTGGPGGNVRPKTSLQGLQSRTPSNRNVSSDAVKRSAANLRRPSVDTNGIPGRKGQDRDDGKGYIPAAATARSRIGTNSVGASKTLPTRPPKARPSLSTFMEESSFQKSNTLKSETMHTTTRLPPSPMPGNSSSKSSHRPGNSKEKFQRSVNSDTSSKSSNTLRETIARAKATRKAASKDQSIGGALSAGKTTTIAEGIDDDLALDPFDQPHDLHSSKGLLRKRVDLARAGGRLDIAALHLSEIPKEVMAMYDPESAETSSVPWFEAVDLVHFVAADNEIEKITPEIFPDIDSNESLDSEDPHGNLFGGLQTLDLHGNLLTTIPVGLRRLEMLSKLNLSHNQLGNDCLDVIADCHSLKELKLARNQLAGHLSANVMFPDTLETLDLHENGLTALPDTIARLKTLRILNVAENKITSIPFKALQMISLTEVHASKNNLNGVLIPGNSEHLPKLRVLDIANNKLTALTEGDRSSMPELQQLNVSGNLIASLPDISSFRKLLALQAEENQLSALPGGFTVLSELRNANLAGNNIKIIDDQVGLMENLTNLNIARNPLRERGLLNMPTADLKQLLCARLEPRQIENPGFGTEESVSIYQRTSKPELWTLKPGGILDRSSNELHSIDPFKVDSIVEKEKVQRVEINHNFLTSIPTALLALGPTLKILSLEHNKISGDGCLCSPLSLPSLQSLKLGQNTITSLSSLLNNLSAPSLLELDVQINRISSLPKLRPSFPKLRKLFANSNAITELAVESLDGLEVVDLRDNDIHRLPPELGLLNSIRSIEVSGNSFRVPRYTILKKGTEALMAWLRDRLPESQRSDLRAEGEMF